MSVGASARLVILALLAPLVTVAQVLHAPAAGAATVTPGLPHADWVKSGGGEAAEVRSTYRIGIDPTPQSWQRPPNVYWANQFNPRPGKPGGYFGLLAKSAAPNKAALFSWWDTLDVSCAGVPNVVGCGPFGHEGSGYSVGVAFDWQEDTEYTFRMWRGDHDSGRDADWWHVEILGDAGVRLAPLGAILVPAAYGGITSLGQWSEWFAAGSEAADHCDQIPEADTWFGTPVLDGVAATPVGIGVLYDAPCPAEAVWSDGGSRQRIGTSTPATTTSTTSTTTTTTVPEPVAVQSALSSWSQPTGALLDGIGGWIATANEPVGEPGGLPPSYLYAHAFGFSGSSAGGFVGLVTAPSGKYAVISVKGPTGPSYDALMPFSWKAGRFYFPLVHQLGPGVWGAWVYDNSAGVWVPIGVLSLPASWGKVAPTSLTAAVWIGPPTADSCSAYPLADVLFHRPTGFSGGRTTDADLGTHAVTPGACPAQTSMEAGAWARYRVGTGA